MKKGMKINEREDRYWSNRIDHSTGRLDENDRDLHPKKRMRMRLDVLRITSNCRWRWGPRKKWWSMENKRNMRRSSSVNWSKFFANKSMVCWWIFSVQAFSSKLNRSFPINSIVSSYLIFENLFFSKFLQLRIYFHSSVYIHQFPMSYTHDYSPWNQSYKSKRNRRRIEVFEGISSLVSHNGSIDLKVKMIYMNNSSIHHKSKARIDGK